MITLFNILAVSNQQVLNTKNICCQHIALQCHSVSIPAINMDDCFHSLLLHKNPACQGTHAHDAVVHIGYNNSVDSPFHATGIIYKSGDVHSLGSVHLCQYNKFVR